MRDNTRQCAQNLHVRTTGATAVVALAFVAFSSVALSSESGTYAPGVSPAGLSIDKGQIILKMKGDTDPLGPSYFKFLSEAGSLNWAQSFSQTGKCGYSSASSYVLPTGSPGGVGYMSTTSNAYGFGVNNNEATSSCNQINKGETFALDFRNGLTANTNRFLDYMILDMELKYTDTVMTVKLYKDASTDVNPTNLVYTYTRSCTSSDCGPDSAGNDNRMVRVPIGSDRVYFNRMVITANSSSSQTAVTLKGGADPGTQTSQFHVAIPAQPVVCGVNIPTSGGGTNATVNFTPDPGQPCPTDKAYLLTTGSKSIEILTGGSSAHVTAVVNSTWAPEPALSPVPPSRVFPPAAGEDEVWCNGSAASPVMPAPHVWCRIWQSSQVVSDGIMQVSETSLLIGDALISRSAQ